MRQGVAGHSHGGCEGDEHGEEKQQEQPANPARLPLLSMRVEVRLVTQHVPPTERQ